jgi:hypothetical protein
MFTSCRLEKRPFFAPVLLEINRIEMITLPVYYGDTINSDHVLLFTSAARRRAVAA